MLSSTFKNFDNATLNYDLEKHNWPAWALSVIQEIAPQVSELETLHEVLSPTEIVTVARHVQNACSRKSFMERFDNFVLEYISPLLDGKRFMVQRQGTLRVVIPDQTKVGRRLQFHQGIWVGNGRGLRTVWTPFTEARGTNTMQILPLDISKKITKQVYDEKMSMEDFEELSMKYAFPVTLRPGQSHLFFQEHIHGNVNNDEGYTRVSMDMRILVEGEDPGRRIPGGYFRLLGDYEVDQKEDLSSLFFVTYAGWGSKFTNRIPLPMQRSTIEQYCERKNISYSDYLFENDTLDWFPSLKSYILNKPDGIVLCSIFALPDDSDLRDEILNLALDNNVQLHFANEMLSLKSSSDLEKIKTYLNFTNIN